MNEEKLRVLQMIESGAISAEQAIALLDKLVQQEGVTPNDKQHQKPRWFRVHVSDLKTGQGKVNVNIPLDLVEVGLRMGARFVPEWEPSDYDAMLQKARDGETGQMVDVISDNETIEIFVE